MNSSKYSCSKTEGKQDTSIILGFANGLVVLRELLDLGFLSMFLPSRELEVLLNAINL